MRYLIQDDGYWYVWTEILAKRKDMREARPEEIAEKFPPKKEPKKTVEPEKVVEKPVVPKPGRPKKTVAKRGRR